MQTSAKLLLDILAQPRRLTALEVGDLDRTLRYAECCRILATVGRRLPAAEMVRLPQTAQDRFSAAALWADDQARALRWEAYFVRRALACLDVPVVVLKGGAYLFGGFSNAEGRLISDLDLMVPDADLSRVEQALLAAGYEHKKVDDYDDRYYREWMHELPPLANPHRGLIVDLHHNIAPPVSRLKIDARQLFEHAVPLADGFLRLSDEDLMLHLCVHMFHDGELNNALRELLDIDSLLRHFGSDESFWGSLMARAGELGLQRPLYYGLVCCQQILCTPVPADLRPAIDRLGTIWSKPLVTLMCRTILPDTFDAPSLPRKLAVTFLYWRSHWLRMPPAMLIRHLATQVRRRGGLKRGEEVPPHA